MHPRTLFPLLLLWACEGSTENPPADTASPDTGETSSPPRDTSDDIIDIDGDGYESEVDCDDTDSSIHPDATEIPYDGIDQDCDDQDLADVDDDGYVAEEVGGDDCNDDDPSIHPDTEDMDNGVDDDCDGEIDEDGSGAYDDWPAFIRSGNGEVYLDQVALSSDGGVVVSGHFDGKPDFDPNPHEGEEVSADGSTEDVFVVKVDENRSLLWLAGLTSENSVVPHTMAIDAMDSVLVAGSYDQILDFDIDIPTYVVQSVGGMDGFVGMYGADGLLTWGLSVGGDGDDACHAIAAEAGSHVWIGGSYTANHDFDPGSGKADIRGTPGGSVGGYILRLSYEGIYETHHVFTGSEEAENTAEVRSLAPDDDGLIVAGLFTGTVDFDPSDEGIHELTATGETGLFILRLDGEGGLDWAVGLDGESSIELHSMRLANDQIYLAGGFEGTVDLDPSDGVQITTSAGDLDAFVLTLDDTSGSLAQAVVFGDIGADSAQAIDVDSSGHVYVSGAFSESIIVEEQSLESVGGTDCVVTKISPDGAHSWAYALGSEQDDRCDALALNAAQDRVYIGGWIGEFVNFQPAGWDFETPLEGTIDGWFLYTPAEGP
jgi:hypothetical protein